MTASTPAPAAQSAPTVAERNAAGHARLEQELADVYAKASKGFLRGRKVPKRKDSK